jgi:diguanylate cyclase (GGDEF)-like protein
MRASATKQPVNIKSYCMKTKASNKVDENAEDSNLSFKIDNISDRKLTTAKFIIIFSLIILAFLSIGNYLYDNSVLFYSNSILLSVVVVNILFFKNKIMLLSHIILLLMALGILTIVYLNKGQEYVPIWSFVFIYIAMIMYGYKNGLFVVIGFCLIILSLLFIWVGDTVNMLEFVRFTAVIVISILFSYISERQITTTLLKLSDTQKHLEKVNKIDSLTNIFNRRQFDADFSKAINMSKRSNSTLAFAMLDIDFFKLYNDTYGHQKGDEALITVAKQLKKKMQRASDAVYRIGGEEFAILYQAENAQDAINNIIDLQRSIENLKIMHQANEASCFLTISVGLHLFSPSDDISPEQAFKHCDEQLYKAKDNGRNKVSYT